MLGPISEWIFPEEHDATDRFFIEGAQSCPPGLRLIPHMGVVKMRE